MLIKSNKNMCVCLSNPDLSNPVYQAVYHKLFIAGMLLSKRNAELYNECCLLNI